MAIEGQAKTGMCSIATIFQALAAGYYGYDWSTRQVHIELISTQSREVYGFGSSILSSSCLYLPVLQYHVF